MNKNFLRLAVANIDLELLNIDDNLNRILKTIEFADKSNVDILQFSELTLSGLSSGDLISHDLVLEKSYKALLDICKKTKDYKVIFSLGLALKIYGNTYSLLAIIQAGKVLAFIPKKNNEGGNRNIKEFKEDFDFTFNDRTYRLTKKRLFCPKYQDFLLAFDFEDDISLLSPKEKQAINILSIAGSSEEYIGNPILENLTSLSKLNSLAISYAGPSSMESSTDMVYNGRKIILEDGKLLAYDKSFNNGLLIKDINLDQLKRKHNLNLSNYSISNINLHSSNSKLERTIKKSPFIPEKKDDYNKMMESILNIQANALIRRLKATNSNKVFIGISGGLDSTLALIVSSLAFYKMKLDPKNIYGVIMPGLGTSSRTLENARALVSSYGASLKEIDIKDSVLQHFKDIDHDQNEFSTVYENSQARERTQILMDLANKHGGLVVGTGNMSEIALGWSTYNGDHMAMYSVNAGIPKTLLREVVRYISNNSKNQLLKETISDIIDTPISPELIPGKDGEISQKTEEKIGPYELHDFFIYHFIRNQSSPDSVLLMANIAFKGIYSPATIEKWLDNFLRRFTSQQFKRSCMPDGPKVLDFSLSPRQGLIMASDININAFRR